MFVRHETKERLIQEVESPRSYSYLKKELSISDPTLQKHLSDLQQDGLISKDSDSKYILTEKGVQVLNEIKLIRSQLGEIDLLKSLSLGKIENVINQELFRRAFEDVLDKLMALGEYAEFGFKQSQKLGKIMKGQRETVYVLSVASSLILGRIVNGSLRLQIVFRPIFNRIFPDDLKHLVERHKQSPYKEPLLDRIKQKLGSEVDFEDLLSDNDELAFHTNVLLEKSELFRTSFEAMLDSFKDVESIRKLGDQTKSYLADLSKEIGNYRFGGLDLIRVFSNGQYKYRLPDSMRDNESSLSAFKIFDKPSSSGTEVSEKNETES